MASQAYTLSADFLRHSSRRLFHVLYRPEGIEPLGSVLFLHAFAEEMHKARRNVAAQARLLANNGYNVMLIDFTGCGDGDGDFADASWQLWREDAESAIDALKQLSPAPVTVWGLRLGALLGCELAQARDDINHLLFWQPVLNGEQQVDQFLRLRTAAAAVGNSVAFDRKTLWNELRRGETLEIAGYEFSSTLALEIAQLRLLDLGPPCTVGWLEIGGGADGSLALPSQNVIAHWLDHGIQVDSRCVPGEPFWRNHDAGINSDLQRATMELLP